MTAHEHEALGYVEAVGLHEIERRMGRIVEQLEPIREAMGANEREHRELVDRHNLLCDEYDRLSRKRVLLDGEGVADQSARPSVHA